MAHVVTIAVLAGLAICVLSTMLVATITALYIVLSKRFKQLDNLERSHQDRSAELQMVISSYQGTEERGAEQAPATGTGHRVGAVARTAASPVIAFPPHLEDEAEQRDAGRVSFVQAQEPSSANLFPIAIAEEDDAATKDDVVQEAGDEQPGRISLVGTLPPGWEKHQGNDGHSYFHRAYLVSFRTHTHTHSLSLSLLLSLTTTCTLHASRSQTLKAALRSGRRQVSTQIHTSD